MNRVHLTKAGRLILVAMLVATLMISACTTPTPEPTKATVAPTAAPTKAAAAPTAAPTTAAAGPKGTLTVAAAEVPESLDPTISLQIYNWTISYTMFDTLVKFDSAGKIVPSLATSWELVNSKTWKFNLRKDVKFHDGQPFTSADVKATLDHILDPNAKSKQTAIWASYEKTETPDAYTAIVYTKEPMGTMLGNLTLTLVIPAKPSKPYNDFPIGTGPFKFVEWKKDDRITVAANADYWGGAPKMEKIVFRTIPELATRVSALERGEVDLVDIVPPEEFARLQKAGVKLVDMPTTYLRFIFLGNQGPLANVKVRQAINLAIDRKSIIKDLFGGKAFEVDGAVAPGVVGYCKMPELKYDPKAAKQLMIDAGFPNGFELEMKTAEYLAKQKELAELNASYLAEIGIKVKVTVQDQALWLQDLLALNYQADQIGTATLTGDADYTLRRLYHTSAKRTPFKNDKLDQLLIAQQGETDAAKRQQMFCDVAKIIWDDVPTVFLFGTVQTYGISPKVKGFQPLPSQFMFFKDVSVE
jgi:peptide/nickel transport system substrate-binding protein